MKKGKRLLCGVLALLLVLSLTAVGTVQRAYATKSEEEQAAEEQKKAEEAAQRQAEMDELERKKQEKKDRIAALQKQIADAKSKKEDVIGTKTLLDQRNQLLMEEIDDTKAQIDLYAEQIQVYQEMEEEQYALFCQQVRSEEERGSLSYLSVLFKATSMADLLNRMEFVNEVAEYNKTLIAAMKETRENIKAEKTEMEAKEAQLGEQQGELQGKLDETTNLMNEYAADQRELEKLYAAEEAAGKAIVAEINRLMAESDVVPSAEGFIWPVTTSRKISSPQGNRVSPGNGIGSSNHKGVDICNVSYSSKIYATKSGKVLIASMPYSDPDGGKSGYGNYVVIDHGGGMSTLYAHMSIVKVSVGQYVTQGDVIGVTGNTGASTGPHLHYEVHSTTMVNGRAVTVYENPLNYLPGYIAAW